MLNQLADRFAELGNPATLIFLGKIMTGIFDVVIVGGGAAGLSAAIVLRRCRRRVILIDAGNPRNQPSQAIH
jgi:NADPH-dependent 2,4-dienoyl-CoA reductase/sulfur reductase-like enzyme